MNIKTMLELPAKTKVPAISAIIERVSGKKSGGSGDKTWSVQNVVIKDDSGKVKVSIWGHPEIPGPSAGQWLFITPGMSDKYGSFGVQTEINEWQDEEGNTKSELQLKVSAKASVKVGPASQQTEQPPVLVPVRTQAQMTAAPEPPRAAAAPSSTGVSTETQILRNCVATAKRAAQLGNAYMIAIDRAKKISNWAQARHGLTIPDVSLCAWVTSIVIDLTKGAYTSSLPDNASVEDYLKSLKIPLPPPPLPLPPEPVSQSPIDDSDVPF